MGELLPDSAVIRSHYVTLLQPGERFARDLQWLDRRRSNQNCPSRALLLEKRRRERGDLTSASFPQTLPNHPSCLPQHSEFLSFPGEWKSLSFTCLPLSLVELELQSAPLFHSTLYSCVDRFQLQHCRSQSTSTITIIIFRASAFIFTGTLRKPPNSPRSPLSRSPFPHPLPLLRVPTFRRCASASVPGGLTGLHNHPPASYRRSIWR